MTYRDPIALWSDAVPRSQGKARPHYNFGNALRDSGDMEGAVREWKRAVEIDPRYSMAYNQLGTACFLSGALTEAERYYLLSVASEPDNAEAHYNLALVSESLGKTGQAIYHYQQFIGRAAGQPADVLRQATARLRVLRNR
jgi:superkiller protein 3